MRHCRNMPCSLEIYFWALDATCNKHPELETWANAANHAEDLSR
jgi:hypothetical protein